MLNRGDDEGREVWQRIGRAIEALRLRRLANGIEPGRGIRNRMCLSQIVGASNILSALCFLISALCWIKAESVKHPNFIDLGVLAASDRAG
jgi:hypothetical protein